MKTEKYEIRWYYSGTSNDHRVTTCWLKFGSGLILASSTCNPKDKFNKEKGRKLSLARAMSGLRLDKCDRELIWEAYRTMGNKKRW